MGSGKTAVGRQLARSLGLKFYDSDRELQKRTGVEIAYIFEKEGEAGFREREAEMIDELTRLQGVLVATGGGAILDPSSRKKLAATGLNIYLQATVDEQLKRTSRNKNRPLLARGNPRETLAALAAIREPLYTDLADVSIDTSGQRVKTVAENLRQILEQRGLVPLQN